MSIPYSIPGHLCCRLRVNLHFIWSDDSYMTVEPKPMHEGGRDRAW